MAQPSRGKSGFKYALLGASMLMSSVSIAHAEDAAPAKKADSDVVVVTGFKKSYADAVRAKRNNIEITDGISSDGLGRFPDLNVGEALQRIPGVQINREAEGRNATIGLRGMPGYYARTTLNGQAFAEPPVVNTTGGADGTPLGAFNSDIFTAFSIEKSPMANAQSGGLSGNIDMQIAPALSRKDGGFFKASLEHNTLGDLNAPAYTLSYNKHFGSDFAVFGTIAYKKENFRRDTLRYNGYSRLTLQNSGLTAAQFASKYGAYYSADASCNTTANPFCKTLSSVLGSSAYNDSTTGTKGQDGVYYLDFLRQYTRMNVGNLWTGSAGMEWKPNDNTKIGLIGFYTDRNLPNTVQYFLLNQAFVGTSGVLSTVSSNDTPAVMSDGRALLQTVTYTNYDGKSSARLYSQHQQSKGFMANLDWKNETWHLTGVLTMSEGYNASVESEFDLRTVPTAAGNGLTSTINTGFGSLSAFSQVSSPTPQQAIYALPFYDATGGSYVAGNWNWKNSDPENLYTADGTHVLNVSGSESFADNKVSAAQFDLDHSVQWGPVTNIVGGIRLEDNHYNRRGFRNMAYGIQSSKITSSMLVAPPSVNDFMEGKAAITQNWQVIDPFAFLSAITPVTAYNGGGLTGVGLNTYYGDGAYATGNYDVWNNMTEAYLQAKYDTQILGHRLRGNVGVRSETTDYKVQTLNQVGALSNGSVGSASNFTWQEYGKKYSHLLPSAIAVLDINDDMVLRTAFYKTYVRPLPQNSNPVQNIGTTATASTNASLSTSTSVIKDISISLSARNLKAYTGDSFDLSWEWYNRPNGVISLAWFKKTLNNRVENITDPAVLCPSDGGGWGLGALTWDGTYCTAGSQTTTSGGVTTTYHVNTSGQYNVDKPTYVTGLEFNLQQNLDFLPGFWKNFGGNFNYAFMQAKQTGSGASASPFPGISKYTFNTIVYYETPKYGVRAVYNWRSAYPLTAAGTYTGAARIAAARGQLDVSASYNINDRISVSLDAYNLTNSYRKEYETDPRMVRWIDYDGRTYTFTVKGTF